MKPLAKIIWQLPFSYFWMINYFIPKKTRTILDIGTGKGELGSYIKKRRNVKIHGIDIYKPYIEKLKTEKIYDKVWVADLKIIKITNKYDTILCSQVLEHLEKENAIGFIHKCERHATKAVIIGIPNGSVEQEQYDGNVHQAHQSSWSVGDLKSLGYNVYGQGAAWLYSKKNSNKFFSTTQLIVSPLSYFESILFFLKPSAAAQLIAIKYINGK